MTEESSGKDFSISSIFHEIALVMGSKLKYIITALFTLSISGSYAADFIVESGETVTTTQILSDVGDQGLIEQGGSIDVSGNAVQMQNNNQKLFNHGTINTQLDTSIAVYNQGVFATIASSGSISTSGNSSHGIFNEIAGNSYIENSGSISTLGSSHGIFNLNSSNSTLINSGSIVTSGFEARGIANRVSADTLIKNSGYIFTSGTDAAAIWVLSSDNTHVINSGTVISEQDYAVRFGNTMNPLLTLQKGSNLQGEVGSVSDTLNLNVEKGLNLLLTLSDESLNFGDLNIDSPYVDQVRKIV